MTASLRFLLPVLLCTVATLMRTAAADFVVTSIGDSGPGSLRQAILDANAAPNTAGSVDRISFELTDPSLIVQVTGSLPQITEPVYLDGSTQINPIDFSFGAPVEIRSTGLNPGESILTVGAAGTSVRKLTFYSTTAGNTGVTLGGTGGHTLVGVTVGMSLVNQLSSPLHGIVITSDDNTVQECRVGGASGDGIRITGSRNRVTDNTLGLKVGAFTGPANASNNWGIHLIGGDGNIIGGTGPNQISAGVEGGIWVEGGSGHRILANNINAGSDLLVDALLGNSGHGIKIGGGASDILLEGAAIQATNGANLTVAGATSVKVSQCQISGGTSHGIVLGEGVSGITIEDCQINHAPGAGIHLEGGSIPAGPVLIRHNAIGSNQIGIDVVSGMGQVTIGTRRQPNFAGSNSIYLNSGGGIVVRDPSARVRISENAIQPAGGSGGNVQPAMAINLMPLSETINTETANDVLDADAGPNALQNKPVITAVTGISPIPINNVRIAAELRAKPSTTYVIEALQHNPSLAEPVNFDSTNPSGGFPAGYNLSITVTTDATGFAAIQLNMSRYRPGWKVALTATSPDGETSEYSNAEVRGFAAPVPPLVTDFPILTDQTSLTLPENSSATGSSYTIVRPTGYSGAFDASISLQYNYPQPAQNRFPSLRYRFSPSDPWTDFSTFGILTISFGAGDSTRNIHLSSFDDTGWDPTGKPSNLQITLGTTSKTIPVTFPDNDPPPVFTASNVPEFPIPPNPTFPDPPPGYYETSTADRSRIRFIADRTVSADMNYRITVNAVQSSAIHGQDFRMPNYISADPFAIGYTTRIIPGTLSTSSSELSPINDVIVEGDEIISFNIVSTTAGFSYSTVVPLTLKDDDFYRVSIGDASVAEGNSGTSLLSFPVTVPQAIPEAVTFDVTTAAQTATAGVDFTVASGTFTLPANSTSGTIQMEVIGDALIESAETFTITLSNPSRATDVTLARATAIGTITNDDFPKVSVADRSVTEEAGSISFAVRLDQPAPTAGSVAWSITGGSATFNSDYYVNTMSGTVNFAAGSSSAIIALSILRDSIPESNETIQLHLSNPVNLALGASVAVITIQDDDIPILFNPSQPILLTEGDTGSQILTITLALNSHAVRAGSVDWSVTADSTAVNAASGTVHFAVGDLTATLVLSVPGDLVPQAIRTVKLAFSNPVEVALSGQTFTVATILDNDQRVLSGSALTLNEGTGGTTAAGVEISIPAPLGVPVSVSWQTANGSALAGSDFTSASGTATIPAGQTSASIPLTILADSLLETAETFSITLSSPVNATLAATSYSVTITNDDAQPALEIEASNTVTVGGSGNFRAWIEIVLPQDAVYNFPLTWRVSTRDETALAGTHYTGISNGLLTVPASTNGFAPDPLWIAITVPGGAVNLDTARRFFVDFTPVSGPATVVSAEVKIEPLRVIEFNRLLPQLYAVRFPTGKGQTYVIQEAATLAGPWVNNSSTLLGSGSPVTQTVSSATNRAYFRVRASSNPPAVPVTLGNP